MEGIAADRERFLADPVLQDAAAYNLLAIGEACSHLPEDLKASLPGIPWQAIRGLRNLLAHEYFVLDPVLLHQTAVGNIPLLVQALEGLGE